ncbi:MAG TPA: ISL3 family transposase [Roseiarcus sp.]|nr:ISL3 family transposase [Roseiarcus sp.]
MQGFDVSELIPRGFMVESATKDDGGLLVAIRAAAVFSRCPLCGTACRRVHSHYRRRLADLPAAGVKIALTLRARRFFCDDKACARRVFAERFETVEPRARRTSRLDDVVHCLAIALGGRPAASLSRRLNVDVSNDTLLRTVRRRGPRAFAPPSIIGIDDWAWRRNHRYGTLVCDLERRRTIALLPDREPATAQAWLALQAQICVVARDRGGGYAVAAQRALPHAIQVADRWHLMENASSAFLDAVRKSMRQIRAAIGANVIDPTLLTFAEKLQYDGYLRREETNAAIVALSEQGVAIKAIVRRTGYSRGLIRKILRGQRSDIFRVRKSSLEPYLPWLDEQWEAGCRNGAALWRELKERGFRGCLGVVSEWSARRKRAEKADPTARARAPSARTVARLLTIGRERLSKAETLTVAAVESGVAVLVEARDIIQEFHGVIRREALDELDGWISKARSSLVASFANGVSKDKAAVAAAIALPWSNGQTEGQICKLKLVKRQMYGRGNLDLLQARVIGIA